MEDCHLGVLEAMFNIQDAKFLLEADEVTMVKAVDDVEKDVVEYITKFNKKILENVSAAADVAISVNYPRAGATVNNFAIVGSDFELIKSSNTTSDEGVLIFSNSFFVKIFTVFNEVINFHLPIFRLPYFARAFLKNFLTGAQGIST